MQVYVSCPFCSRVFDCLEEPHAVLRVDNHVRRAHLKCFRTSVPAERLPVFSPASSELADTELVKPNGAEPTTS